MRDLVATREYFPRRIQAAIRQRTRWVTGITLQGWQRSGWKGSWPTKYWFWRDRKGLVANPLSLLTNVIFGIGLFDLAQSVAEHRPWIFTATNPVVRWLCSFTFALQWFRITLRVVCVTRIYGLLFALGVPLRALYGNLINCAASVRAVYTFVRAKLRRQQVAWLKTDHAYPNRSALPTHRRDLPEVIVSAGIISREELSNLHAKMGPEEELADFLLAYQILSEEELCQALSLQSGLPVTHVETGGINARVIQSLPVRVQERFGIVPYRVEEGRLLVAGTRVLSSEVLEDLKRFSQLPLDFQLVTRRNYNELRALVRQSAMEQVVQ
jgi:bacteriophage N4 adsorption protein B